MSKRRWVLCLTALFTASSICLLSTTTAATAATPATPPAPTVELVNSLGGNISTVALSGTTAYVGEGMTLVALDISNPAQPVRRGSLLLPATVRGLQVISGTAYIADDGQGLQIVDVRNPSAPVKLGSYVTAQAAIGIYVVNQRAYLACGTGGLWIFDVTDPAHPAVLGAYAGTATNVWVAGSLAAIVDGDLRLLNVSDPAHPTLTSSYVTTGTAQTVQISGTVAYIADINGLGLAAIDISNPVSPTLLGQAESYSYSDFAVSVAGNYAYAQTLQDNILASTSYCATQIFDIRDPSHLKALGQWSRVTKSGPCNGHVLAAGSRVVAANSTFEIVDVSAPLTPTVVGSYLPLVKPLAAAVAGNLAYVADGEQRLVILDVSNPLSPTVLGSYSTAPGIPRQVQVWGGHAYVNTTEPSHPHFPSGQLLIVDVSNPYRPTLSASYPTAGDGRFIIQGDRAYVMRGRAGFAPELDLLDVSNPINPLLLGTYGPYTQSLSLIGAANTFAYLQDISSSSLQVLDVSQPATPTVRSTLPISLVAAAEMQGAVMYAAMGTAGLQLFDLSNPLAPQWRATYAPSGTVSLVTVAGNNACVTTGGTNLQILNVSQPFSLTLQAAFSATYAPAAKLQVVGDTLYVVDAERQLEIFRYATSVSATLTSAAGTLLSAPDATSYAFPANTFIRTVYLKHTVRAAANLPATGDLIDIGHNFEITAVDSATQQPVPPRLPYTLTLQYTAADVGPALENTLGLYYWSGSQWVKEPSAALDIATKTFTAHPDHFSLWAVLGQTRRMYLPLGLR